MNKDNQKFTIDLFCLILYSEVSNRFYQKIMKSKSIQFPIIFLLFFFGSADISAQNKKEQIASLNYKIDSLGNLLTQQISEKQQIFIKKSNAIDSLKRNIGNLNISLQAINTSNDSLNKELITANKKVNSLNLNLDEVIKNHSIQVLILKNKIDSLNQIVSIKEDSLKKAIQRQSEMQNINKKPIFLTSNIIQNKLLLPQEIEYDGKPGLECTFNDKIITLDSYDENDESGEYIRMKINNKEMNLKKEPFLSDTDIRIYSNNEYRVTFRSFIYETSDIGEAGEHKLSCDLLIEFKNQYNRITIYGYEGL